MVSEMRQVMNSPLPFLVVSFTLFFSVYMFGFYRGKKYAERNSQTRTDTVVVYKTKLVDKPVLVETRQTDFIFASFPEERVVYKTDSVQVEIPIEQKVYEDTTYRAVVSGFRPSLDSLLLKVPTTYITNTETQYVPKFRKWDFGVQVGVGMLFPASRIGAKDGPGVLTDRIGGYVGYGVTYHF